MLKLKVIMENYFYRKHKRNYSENSRLKIKNETEVEEVKEKIE